ncbi:MAG: hypothetical protein E3J41_05600 [Candidatus Cloacimonadota bacterium]|nr:MAG: hypothetical protein E3J41_05600 [Candidatus Cloacimonadota bacterium]
MNERVIDYAAQCYGITKSQLKPLSGGHWNLVYEFSKNNKTYVLRIAPIEININVTKGMVEWIDFLSTHGASVSKPVFSVNNRLVEFTEKKEKSYSITVFEKAKGILAEKLSKDEWNDELCQNIGKTVGKMHAVSKVYIPLDHSIKRPEWNMIGNCYNAQHLDSSQAKIKEKDEKILKYVIALPKDKKCYGLIHADLHFANLYVDVNNNRITIFDFDDCSYGWYVMDIAMALFDLVVLFDGSDKYEFSVEFMKNYLRGYITENPVNTYWIKQIPYFLKLLEIGVYSQIYKNYDANNDDPWCRKFMANRKYRIENDIPYISVDFEDLLEIK